MFCDLSLRRCCGRFKNIVNCQICEKPINKGMFYFDKVRIRIHKSCGLKHDKEILMNLINKYSDKKLNGIPIKDEVLFCDYLGDTKKHLDMCFDKKNNNKIMRCRDIDNCKFKKKLKYD